MKLRHNSRDARFRVPYGAVPVGTTVKLALEVRDLPEGAVTGVQSVQATLRVWVDGQGESLVPMRPEGGTEQDCRQTQTPPTCTGQGADADAARFVATLPCPTAEIVWYSFIVQAGDEVRHLGCRAGSFGGEGVGYASPEPPSFQISVYEPREEEPTWYTRGMVYQIFPDRYRRDEAWRGRAQAAFADPNIPRGGAARRIVEDWDTPPSYERDERGAVTCWDFHAGSLLGIRDDLPRLQELGVTAIYLNPIFEAASNHRYDVADYFRVDPMLGTEADFRELCRAADARGISIILDGVFNHVGADSRYFNRFGTYARAGAWQEENGRGAKAGGGADGLAADRTAACTCDGLSWHDAFTFRSDGSYECWWGVDALPAFKKGAPQVRRLLLGPDGVIRHWLRLGARGWRLDVADELTDELIEQIRADALAERPDAVIVGEVWEDASNKTSYGKLRRYLQGRELDGAMNYPFRTAVLDFLCGTACADACAEALESMRENYPPQALRASLNLLGSHDRPRLLTVLAGLPDADAMTEGQRAAWRVGGEALGLAKGRFWLAVLLQMTMPGVPCIYYGDEAGLQGLADPYNRAPYPWGREDADAQTMVKNAADLRRALPWLADGGLLVRAAGEDVLVVERWSADAAAGANADGAAARERLCVLVNRSAHEWRSARVRLAGADGTGGGAAAPTTPDAGSSATCSTASPAPATDLISGATVCDDGDGFATVWLPPLGSAAVWQGPAHRLAKPLEPGVGVLAHVTSLPTEDGRPGHIGAPAFRFVDALSQAGVRYWQLLPVNPVDAHGSPYAGPSAFAGNVGLLPPDDPDAPPAVGTASAIGTPAAPPPADDDAAFAAWCAREAHWLEPYCAFMAVRELCGGAPRSAWPTEFARYDRALLHDPRIACRARAHARAQFRFDRAWHKLLDYAHERGVQVVGDVPFYVSADSADAWAAPQLFNVDAAGRILEEAGCPPDQFSATGQAWGSPTYDWAAMAADDYRWWVARLRRACELYDYVRLDHFLGFWNYYGIPAGRTALEGAWHPGPGRALFDRAHDEIGPLPFFAEDLGILTPAVHALRTGCGFCGMDVVQFADYDVRAGLRPHPDKLLYTGTHDTNTLAGWCAEAFGCDDGSGKRPASDSPPRSSAGAADANAAHAHAAAASPAPDAARSQARMLLADALSCGASVVVVPLQDAALLGAEARMNTPATTRGNWRWQATPEQAHAALETFAELAAPTTGRPAGNP